MTLIRQIWLMLFGVLLLALVGSVTIQAVATQQSLRALMQLHNDEGAAILALALSQQQGDVGRMQPLAVAQFDAGHYQQLRLLDNDGKVLFELEKAAPAGAAPAWFAHLLPVSVKPGVAMIADGRRPLGSVQLHGQASWANDELWAGCWRMAGWLAVLGLAATAMAALALRTWRRSLEAAAAQAQALEERRFIIADEPKLPELRRLTRSMNSLVRRLQRVFEHQAAQLDELRVQAHLDALTGLSKRRHFMAQLDAALQARRHRGAGLLLVRVRELQAMNQRIGHEATDRLLAAVAQVLLSYPRRVKGALTGRLNGADFALYLPAAGLAAETASSLVDALRAALATVDLGAEMVIGGTDLPLATDVAAALSSADAALAQAESRGPFAVEILAGDDANGPALGKDPWKARLVDALQSGRLALTETEVQDRTGVLLHLECRPGLQLEPGGPFEPATSWLAMARCVPARCRGGPGGNSPCACGAAARRPATLRQDRGWLDGQLGFRVAGAAATRGGTSLRHGAMDRTCRRRGDAGHTRGRGQRVVAPPGRATRPAICRHRTAPTVRRACVGHRLHQDRRRCRAGHRHRAGVARSGAWPGDAAAQHGTADPGRRRA